MNNEPRVNVGAGKYTARNKMKYKHIFLRKGYVVAVFYREDKDTDQSRFFVCGKYDSVRVELA